MGKQALETPQAISERTKQALAAAKARGVVLGNAKGEGFTAEIQQAGAVAAAEARKDKADTFAARVKPMIDRFQGEGLSLRRIAGKLNEKGINTPRGKEWTATAIKNALAR